MNRIWNTGLMCCLSALLMAAPPIERQKVYSIVKQYNSLKWYETQAKLWVVELERDNKNPDSWLNYYTAKRMEKILGDQVKQKNLDNIVVDIAAAIPGSFEHHYITYWNGNNSEELFEHLEKAFALSPDRPETYDDFITHYELLRDRENTAEFCQRMFDSNDISANVFAWNYNVLMSTDQDAILITYGDNDTYPAMILQHIQNIREDIAVMNISMMGHNGYREAYFSELGIPKMTKTRKDFESGLAFNKAICRHLKENSERPIYFAISVAPSLYEDFDDDLYNVGLAFKWTDEKFDNIAVMKKNYEKKFLKDYLKVDLYNDISASVSQYMNASYLMPLLTLHNHYEESEERQSFSDIEALIKRVAQGSGRTDEVDKILGTSPTSNIVSYVITDPRDVYRGMLPLNDTLHASIYETTVGMYDKFLLDLLKQRRFEDLAIAKNEATDWRSYLLPMYKELTDDEMYKNGPLDDDRLPVCNISYQAAELYCEWVTNIYNNLEHRKKKYKKVVFRLPTEKEWEYLAHGGQSTEFKYPWGQVSKDNLSNPKYKIDPSVGCDNITNSRGCFLANLQTERAYHRSGSEKGLCPNFDGAIFRAPGTSYSRNSFGLFCTIGNVAEMVQEKGVTKGGGWNTSVKDAYISSRQTYDGPSPNVGFRVVMVVLEK